MRPLGIAVYGILGDGLGSGAGAYTVLLRALLERGHRVEFFGNPGYVRPRSLEAHPGYRFHPLQVDAAERLYRYGAPYALARAMVAQASHVAYAREAVRCIEREHRRAPYDFSLCTDMQPLFASVLPAIAWPQSPPHTEAAALRAPDVRRAVIETSGVGRFALVQAYYAYRAAAARLALGCSDLYLCGSRWAAGEWRRFGADPARLRPFAYPIELDAFDGVAPLAARPSTTFLWLGRAVPRKRLDLFLQGFALLKARHPAARARIVGAVGEHPVGRSALERYGGIGDLTLEGSIPRADVPTLFSQCDIVVQPSQNENFGFSVAEALAAGRAIVAGPSNGTLEYAGAAGFGFAEYTAESVAGAMEQALLATRARPAEVSASAREAARVFALDAVTERFCVLGRELAATKRKL